MTNDETKLLLDIQSEIRNINAKLKRIEKILSDRSVPPSWISARRVNQFTGWEKHRLREAREHDTIKYKPTPGGGYVYLLESINPIFILNKIEGNAGPQ